MKTVFGSTEKMLVDEFQYVHTLKNVVPYTTKDVIKVPGTFSGDKSKFIKWSLEITPIWKTYDDEPGYSQYSQFHIELRGQAESERTKDLSVKVDISITVPTKYGDDGNLSIRRDETQLRRYRFPYSYVVDTPEFEWYTESGKVATVVWDRPTEHAKHPAVITITCKIKIIKTLRAIQPCSMALSDGLQRSLKKMWDSRELTDTTIVTKDGTVSAHKTCLAAKSPVFRAMFSTDMREASSNQLEIPDFNKDIVSAMLEFIYTDATEEVAKRPYDMLRIADKYDLGDLQDACISVIFGKLNVENAIFNLVFADDFQLGEFKKAVLDFFRKNHLEIAKLADYDDFVKDHKELYLEVLAD